MNSVKRSKRAAFERNIIYVLLIIIPFCANAGAGSTAPSLKLEHNLRSLVTAIHSSSTQAYSDTLAVYAKQLQLITVSNSVFVEIFINDTAAVNNDFLVRYGIARDNYFSRFGKRVQALVPAAKLDQLAADSAVNWVQPPAHPHAEGVSEGVNLTYANTYHNHVPPYAGAGVKVAIVDLGFYGYQQYLGNALPSNVTVKSFRSDGDITGGGEDHGTACAEVVHDMAPGAQLYLINFYTVNDLQNALNYCLDSGVQIISHSIGWTNLSFYDGKGPVSQIVNDADAAGILWCSAAGNDAQGHWDGTFNDPDNNGWENFNGSDESINVYLTSNNPFQLDLTWDQWPYAKSDYDLYLYNDNNGSAYQVVASSTNVQYSIQPPTEEIIYTPSQSGLYHIKIKHNTGVAARLALFSYETTFADYNIAARSIVEPGDASGAYTVGAVGVTTLTSIEPYSGEGPTEDGRMKPDISAPDCNSSDVYGVFCGTSSSTPHTAGAAALLLSQNNSMTNTHLKNVLTANAQDLGAPGADNVFGAGFLRMPDITPPLIATLQYSFDTAHSRTTQTSVIFTWKGSDSWSGVRGYSYVIDNSPTTQPAEGILTTSTSTEILLDNSKAWYIHLIAVDSAGNWSNEYDLGPLLLHSIGVNEPAAPGNIALNVYPNPANETAMLSWNGHSAEPTFIQVYDILGRVVSSVDITAGSGGYQETVLNVRDLSAGMYIVRAVTPEKTVSVDLLVAK